ncbi:MAG: hypothetical protein ACFFDW_02760 [Candidatus Thorarchaeota archaeon]
MENINTIFDQTKEQKQAIIDLLNQGRRDVPLFCEEGINEVIYVPVEDGELKVYHHTPKKSILKRPILFIPGYVAAPSTWVDFHKPQHDLGEYYYLETREKNSSRIKKSRKVRMDLKQSAKDIKSVIEFLGLDRKDYVLFGSSYGGGIIFEALIKQYINPPTVLLFDPIAYWIYTTPFTNFILAFIPPFILNSIRFFIAKLYLAGMKNQAQKRRMMAFVKGIEPWKFRKCTLQNRKLNIVEDLKEITSETIICHGPLDKYHPRMAYYNYAKSIPKGRLIFMFTEDEERELLAGVIATEFAKVTKNEGIPTSLAKFEIEIKRE